MDKKTFMLVLQSCLLAYDGLSAEDMWVGYGMPRKLAKAGVDLCIYLKKIEIKIDEV